MGAWSSSILGNDTSCEVRERFFELYDLGENPESIASVILEEQKENLECDRTDVWLGLAMACWECKVLTKDILEEVKKIVDTKEDINFNRDLDADEDFLKKRQKALDRFVDKIAVEKPKPRARKKTPVQVEAFYVAGMCLTYKNLQEKYIGIYLTKSEHFRNKGKIEFFFLDFESNELPSLSMFSNSKLYGLKRLGKDWGNYEYQGNVTDLRYEKDTKADFFNYTPNVFTEIGKLKAPNLDKLINNFKGDFMYLRNPEKMIDSIERIRLEGKLEYKLSNITLNELLEKIGQ